jgi:WD40 repeat protein
MSFFNTSSTTSSLMSADKDVEVSDPPSDSISSLAFSPQADYLAVGSWDNNVRPRDFVAFGISSFLLASRYASMKSVPMDRHKGRLCMGIRDQS